MTAALQRNSLCAVVVTYQPDHGIAERVRRIAAQVDRVLVVDNSGPAAPTGLEADSGIEAELGIEVVRNDRNQGIATALNQGARWAFERGYAFVLLFDQDTAVSEDFAEAYAKIYTEVSAASAEGIIVGANFLRSVDGKAGQKIKPGAVPADGSGRWADAVTLVTSGTLLPRRVWETVGPFRDEFFIDCVDEEYCLRARAHGVRVVISTAPMMQHAVGDQAGYRFLWIRGLTFHYSPRRHYCRLRNSVAVWRAFFRREPRWVLSNVLFNVRIFGKICLYEPQKRRKLSALALGLRDGLRSRFDLMTARFPETL